MSAVLVPLASLVSEPSFKSEYGLIAEELCSMVNDRIEWRSRTEVPPPFAKDCSAGGIDYT